MTEGHRKQGYQRIRERATRGDYELVVPFDFLILEHLPEVGSLFAGLYPLGETVATISKSISKTSKETLPSGIVYGRMRSMEVQGLVEFTKGPKSKRIWQRTPKGSEVYKKWKEGQGGTVTSK